jgi:hypothetical protein
MNGFDSTKHPLHQDSAGIANPNHQPSGNFQRNDSIGSSTQAGNFEKDIDQALNPKLADQNPQKGLAKAQDDDPNEGRGVNLTQIGQQFDKISQQLGAVVGDQPLTADFNQVFTGNKDQILKELNQVQQGINSLVDGNQSHFQGVTGVKLHVIANQINIEENFIRNGGESSAIGVRDVQRDILDIVNNDPKLTTASNQNGQHGFTSLAPLQNPPTPFQDNDAQTQFLNQTNQKLNDLVNQSTQVFKGNSGIDANQLVQQIRSLTQGANNFADSQGGIYSARFDNELGRNGTNNTAADQLAKGIETHNKKLVNAADKVLLANIGDVGANQLPVDGGHFAFAAANAGA